MRFVGLALLAAMVGCGGSSATPVKFDIQGLKVGDPMTAEILKEHCGYNIDDGNGFPMGMKTIDMAGNEVSVFLLPYQNKLASVSLGFESDSFDTIITAYTAKFGAPPHETKSEPVKTRLGADYSNTISTWQTTDGPFVVRKYGANVNQGSADLMTSARKERIAAQSAAEAEALKGKL